MISFPVFAELEAKRDRINQKFHRETAPQVVERLQQFGFKPQGDSHHMMLTEQSTGNHYLLTLSAYAITVEFEHIKNGEKLTICEISNFGLSAHNVMDILIHSIDCWLQYGVIYDYRKAQHFDMES